MKKQRCPECKSKMVYLRLSIDQFVCRSCGHEWFKIVDKNMNQKKDVDIVALKG